MFNTFSPILDETKFSKFSIAITVEIRGSARRAILLIVPLRTARIRNRALIRVRALVSLLRSSRMCEQSFIAFFSFKEL